jgi:RNA polymerase sigma factor (sigma-70 family)
MAAVAPELPVLARDQAFETLYRRYVEDVYHYALALLRNPADAEDVTQTTFMNAYRAYSRGEEILKPQHWLIKIAHNVARTRYARASRRVKEVPLEDHVEQLTQPEEDKPDVEAVLHALGRLPFNQRAALVMRELEGRSYLEIAETLGVSVAAVETLIFRGRRSLRLKASALRSLGAVPLPGSLLHMFEGGGVVAAGGSALAGTGFLVKAAIVVATAALATGLGGGSSIPATAAPHSFGAAATPVAGGGGSSSSRHGTAVSARHKEVPSRAEVPGAEARTAPRIATGGYAPRPASRTPVAQTAIASTGSSGSGSSIVPEPVADVVSTVQQVVTSPTSALPVRVPGLPPVPVPVPGLPPLPVDPPPLPKLP